MVTAARLLAEEGNVEMTSQSFVAIPLWLLLVAAVVIGLILHRKKRRP